MAKANTVEKSISTGLSAEMETVLCGSADGIVISNCEGILLAINNSYEKIMGIDKIDFLHRSVCKLVEKGFLSETVTIKALESKKPASTVHYVNGREILFTGTPVLNQKGEVTCVVANVRDMTELNQLKEQLAESKRVIKQYERELQNLKSKCDEEMVYVSTEMNEVIKTARQVAPFSSSVVIEGETGVGKEIVARTIHRLSPRNGKPFITVNCGAIAVNLIESELFGYEEGSFTGAKKGGRKGLFEAASSGTIFLDEIGELSLEMQIKLLRVLQEKTVTRVGGHESTPVDVRVVAATNKNLQQMMQDGKFREDLYFRLNVVTIKIPPLRQRKTDIIPLSKFFLMQVNGRHQTFKRFSEGLLEDFMAYSWPGNVRELKNMVERLAVLSNGEELSSEVFKQSRVNSEREKTAKENLLTIPEMEKRLILENYQKYGSTRKVAKVLGIHQSTVVRKLQKYENGDAARIL